MNGLQHQALWGSLKFEVLGSLKLESLKLPSARLYGNGSIFCLHTSRRNVHLCTEKLYMKGNNQALAWGILLLLAGIWGSSFILIKYALGIFPPLAIGSLRMGIAALLLLPFVIPVFRKVPPIQHLQLAAVGLLGNFIPSFLFPLAETQIHSSLAGMLNVLTPGFTLIVGAVFFGLSFTPRKGLGVLIALSGAVLLILAGEGRSVVDGGNLHYAWLVVLATVLYGFSVNLMKNFMGGLSAVSATSIALFWMLIPALAGAWATGAFGLLATTPDAWQGMLYIGTLAALGTAFALVVFYWLVQMTDPVVSSTVTYLVPVVAIFWGVIDGERLSWLQYLAMGIVLVGVYLVNSTRAVPKALPR